MHNELLTTVSHLAGVLTILISIVGIAVALTHFAFFSKTTAPLGRRVKYVFLTDAAIYFVTALFGFWAFLELSYEAAIVLQYIRIPILLLNIWASVRLYGHYKNIK